MFWIIPEEHHKKMEKTVFCLSIVFEQLQNNILKNPFIGRDRKTEHMRTFSKQSFVAENSFVALLFSSLCC